MSDPHVTRLEQQAMKVHRAWMESGTHPLYHSKEQARLIRRWPVLARAVQDLVDVARIPKRFFRDSDDPDDGHRFRFTVTHAGSNMVVGDEHHHDAEDWGSTWILQVRAWSLESALRRAAALPLVVWVPDSFRDQMPDIPRLTQEKRERTVERLCRVMHDAYEAAAVDQGWETQERSRKPWGDVPEANKATMRVAVAAMLDDLES